MRILSSDDATVVRPTVGRRATRLTLLVLLGICLISCVASTALPAAALAASEMAPFTIQAALPPTGLGSPDIEAPAAIVIDADSGAVLYEKAPDKRLPMASTTKIMTALLVLESLDLDEKVVVPKSATGTYGSLAGLMWGEVLTVEQLMYALLLPSGNDAALTLAEETAGSVPAFVKMMNDKAEEMGLENTHFSNPNGLHLEDHYSSARDLATMALAALEYPAFRRIVDTPTYELPWPGEDQGVREFKNGNALLKEYPWVDGVKTGSTPYAKYCMVVSGSLEGVSLVGVLLGAADDDARWKETKALLAHGLALSPRTVLVDQGQLIDEVDIHDPLGRKVRLVTERALTVRLEAGQTVTATPRLLEEPVPPIHIGDDLGVVDFTLDGTFIASVKLIAARSLDKPAITDVIQHLTNTYHSAPAPAD